MTPSPPRLPSSWFVAAAAIAATYFYFLIFSEFALLELVNATAPTQTRPFMAVLGLLGIAGTVLAVRLIDRSPQLRPTLLVWSFRACAFAALLTAFFGSPAVVLAATALSGLSLGLLTVTLNTTLAAAAGERRLGLCIGSGTGLAYAACNLPPLFQASPVNHALLAAIVTALASFLPVSLLTLSPAPTIIPHPSTPPLSTIVRWIFILGALVWMDSAAFYIVQHTPALRGATWENPFSLLANAATHLLAALLAGALLDRRARTAATTAAALLLAGACLILASHLPAALPASWLYTAGVSLYSVVLVEFPARTRRATVAALVFALSGWLASALGIGMARDLAHIPLAFVLIALAVISLALFSPPRLPRATALALLLTLAFVPTRARAETPDAAQISRGREVYIAEGCIHCHSQFVRPRTPLDTERWGPAPPLATALAATPPLFGTRRQGPDLANVGNRRSAEWQRLHLIAPRDISPGSRMPSYAHLFAGDDRGDALVAYLCSLGADPATRTAREAQIAAWQPTPSSVTASSATNAPLLFRRLCSPCHGPAGHGDGPVAARLSYRPPDWSTTPFRHVSSSTLTDSTADVAIARIIKFGLPGLPMAGHEYLPDRDLVGLARFVRSLHAASMPRPAPASSRP